jgi:TPP-dependent indolepyruvate ferredoxin oxidoreductase alpha subunit
MMGARAFSAMKHVGLNVASDALMTSPSPASKAAS